MPGRQAENHEERLATRSLTGYHREKLSAPFRPMWGSSCQLVALLLSTNSSWSIVDLAKTDVAHVTPQEAWSAKIEKETKRCHNGREEAARQRASICFGVIAEQMQVR